MNTGQVFKTITIGSQEWMAENLNTPMESSWCRRDDPGGTKYGRFYTWEAAKKISLRGWHLPADSEWEELVNQLGGEKIAGEKLKKGGSSGFEAMLRGNRTLNGTFESPGKLENYWTSTEYDREWAWCRYLVGTISSVGHDRALKKAGYAVRCVRNRKNNRKQNNWWQFWK